MSELVERNKNTSLPNNENSIIKKQIDNHRSKYATITMIKKAKKQRDKVLC